MAQKAILGSDTSSVRDDDQLDRIGVEVAAQILDAEKEIEQLRHTRIENNAMEGSIRERLTGLRRLAAMLEHPQGEKG